MLGYPMYRSAFVPPRMALLGRISAPVLILTFVLILIGVHKNGEGPSGLLTLPEAAWELSLASTARWTAPAPRARSPGKRPQPGG